MKRLIYLNDDFNAVVERILMDNELSNCGLDFDKVSKTLLSFNGDEISCSVFYKKYALRNDEDKIIEFTLEEAKERWANYIVKAENNSNIPVKYFRDLYEYLLPAGRQMFALGNEYVSKATLTNCYVTKIEEDSLEGIFETAKKLARTYSYGGGIGICIGELRPTFSKVSNSARFSTGAVSFMELYSLTTGLIGQCVAKGERVLTDEGLKSIESIRVNDKIWTKEGFKKVINTYSNGVKKIFKVTDKFGYQLRVSEDHILTTENNGNLEEIRLKDLKVGDPVVLIPGTSVEIPHLGLEEKGYMCLKTSIRIPKFLEERLAYILGYSYGNGCVEFDKFDTPYSLTFSNDLPEVKEQLTKYIAEVFNYSLDNDLGIYSKSILIWLKHNNLLKQKAGNLIMPELILHSRSSVQMAFISGFFDGKGKISDTEYTINIVDYDFLQQIKIMLMANGITSDNLDDQLIISQSFAREMLNMSVKVRNNNFITNKDEISLPNGLIKSSVNSIEEDGSDHTFDIELEDEHLYFCEGFRIHNSGRRGALMITIPVDHPDVENFINVKHGNLNKVKHANISIKITDDFMDAVINDKPFILKFQTPHENIERIVQARELWNKIVQSARDSAEPGLLFWDQMVRMSPSDTYDRLKVHSTNPCVTGDTLIYVADGRGHVTIKELAENGSDVPVFCLDNNDKIAIRYMRHPRITGYKQPVYKVTFDDGNSVKATKDHKFKMKNGQYKQTDELEYGDSLKIITQYEASKEIFKANSNSSDYIWITDDFASIKSEHRLIAEFHNNTTLKVEDGISNEELKQHAIILTKQLGYRFSNEDWKTYARKNNITEQFSKWRNDHLGGILGLAKWAALECGIDENFVNLDSRNQKHYRKLLDQYYNCIIEGSDIFVIKNCEICGKEYKIHHRYRESGICSQECNSVYMSERNRNSEIGCAYKGSKRYYQNLKIGNAEKQVKVYVDLKFQLGKEPQIKEWEKYCKIHNIPYRLSKHSYFENFEQLKKEASNYNHKVTSVEFCGYEDVYNGTVDEFHNFCLGAFKTTTKFGKNKYFHIVTRQCGEQILESGGTCVLASLLLHKFVQNPFTPEAYFDFDLFKDMIARGVRHLDNVVELNMGKHGLDEQEEASRLGRRIGLGVTGLADMFVALGIKYDSEEALTISETIMYTKKIAEYTASINLAEERGSFPLFDSGRHFERGFAATLPDDIKELAKQKGLRNVAISTIAPSGSLSIIAQCSSGIEPIFALSYSRSVEMGSKKRKIFQVLHQGLPRFYDVVGEMRNESLPNFWVVAHQIDYKYRVKLQSVLQKHIDASISSTINLPEHTDIETVSQIYIDAWKEGLKGITVYREGSREGILITDEFSKVAGVPKMDTAIHCIRAEGGDKFYTIISYRDGNIKNPYQVFVMNYKQVERDAFVKIGNSLVKMLKEKGIPSDRIEKYMNRSQNSLAKLTRFLSLSMKTNNLSGAVSVLNEHAFAGTLASKLHEILQKSLQAKISICQNPNCNGSNVKMEEGCRVCLDCGWSGCT